MTIGWTRSRYYKFFLSFSLLTAISSPLWGSPLEGWSSNLIPPACWMDFYFCCIFPPSLFDFKTLPPCTLSARQRFAGVFGFFNSSMSPLSSHSLDKLGPFSPFLVFCWSWRLRGMGFFFFQSTPYLFKLSPRDLATESAPEPAFLPCCLYISLWSKRLTFFFPKVCPPTSLDEVFSFYPPILSFPVFSTN